MEKHQLFNMTWDIGHKSQFWFQANINKLLHKIMILNVLLHMLPQLPNKNGLKKEWTLFQNECMGACILWLLDLPYVTTAELMLRLFLISIRQL